MLDEITSIVLFIPTDRELIDRDQLLTADELEAEIKELYSSIENSLQDAYPYAEISFQPGQESYPTMLINGGNPLAYMPDMEYIDSLVTDFLAYY